MTIGCGVYVFFDVGAGDQSIMLWLGTSPRMLCLWRTMAIRESTSVDLDVGAGGQVMVGYASDESEVWSVRGDLWRLRPEVKTLVTTEYVMCGRFCRTQALPHRCHIYSAG